MSSTMDQTGLVAYSCKQVGYLVEDFLNYCPNQQLNIQSMRPPSVIAFVESERVSD